MNKSLITLISLISLSPFLIQCATQEEVRTLSYQLRAVNKKVEDLQANTVGDIQKKQASSSGQLNELQREILALKSDLETTAMTNRQLQEQNKGLESSLHEIVSKQSSDTEIKITQLNEQLKQQQDSVATLQAARAQEAERKARAAAEAADAARLKVKMAGSNQGIAQIQAERKKQIRTQGPTSARVETNTPAPIVPTPQAAEPVTSDMSSAPPVHPAAEQTPKVDAEQPAPVASPADDLFLQAQKKYEAGNYQEAYEMFESSLEKNGSGANGIQARYMM
ncbi:MAG: hypothetical protein N2A40_01915, partial [Desulfobulbaceae bacterium]